MSPEETRISIGSVDELAELATRFLGPIATELGGAVGDHLKAWRAARALKLLRRVEERVKELGFQNVQISPKFLVPWLEGASLEVDEDLCQIWANLLASAADPDQQDADVGYIQVLRQMSFTDATLLDAVHAKTMERHRANGITTPHAYHQFVNVVTFQAYDLQQIYCLAGLSRDELPPHGQEDYQPDAEMDRCVRSIGKLVQLRLLEDKGVYGGTGYAVSEFGWRFVEACKRSTPGK